MSDLERVKSDELEQRSIQRSEEWSKEIEAENEKTASRFYGIVGIGIILLAAIFGLFSGSVPAFFSTLLTFGPVGIIIMGLGEVIHFLHKINQNTKNK